MKSNYICTNVACTICGSRSITSAHNCQDAKLLALNSFSRDVANWREKKGFITSWDNMLEKLCLVHSEVSEAAEAYRKDEKIAFNIEIADIFIRLMDICGTLGIDIESEIINKMQYNRTRPFKHGKTKGDVVNGKNH